MTALVRIKPELITAHRLRMEMINLDDEDVENTIRMKGWAWVLARRSWVYAGDPDFIYRQIREVVIGLPDIAFDPQGIEASIRSDGCSTSQSSAAASSASRPQGPSWNDTQTPASSFWRRRRAGRGIRPATTAA